MSTKTLITLAGLIVAVAASPVLAQHGHCGHHGHHGHDAHGEHAGGPDHADHELVRHGFKYGIHIPSADSLEQMGCSARQIEQCTELRERLQGEAVELHAAIDEAEQELEQLHKAGDAGERDLAAADDRLTEAREAALKLYAAGAQEMKEIIGEERFQEIVDSHTDHWGASTGQ